MSEEYIMPVNSFDNYPMNWKPDLSKTAGPKYKALVKLLEEDIEALIKERQEARKAKNFGRADEIRKELLDRGIILEDTREGVKWKRA